MIQLLPSGERGGSLLKDHSNKKNEHFGAFLYFANIIYVLLPLYDAVKTAMSVPWHSLSKRIKIREMNQLRLTLLFCIIAVAVQAQEFYKDANGKWGLKSESGNIILAGKYDDILEFSEELAAVCLNKKWGYIDKTGKEVIPLKYSYVYSFKNGVAKVELNDRVIYINKYGRELK